MTATETDVLAQFPPEIRERLAELLPMLQQAANTVMESDPLRPMVMRGEAIKLQQQAGELFDEADRMEQRTMLAKAVTDAQTALQVAESEASRLTDVARQMVDAERLAADKHADAAEFAREARERVDDLALAQASPAEQTEAILKRDAAEQVAGAFRAKAEQAAAERVQADASLATARDVVRTAKAALSAAERAVDHPPALPPGPLTVVFDGTRRVIAGDTKNWTNEQFGMADFVVEALMEALGLDKMVINRARRELEDEARRKASNAFLPKPGHALRPANAGVTYAPLPPRIG